jgi:hypothetical protein
MGRAGKNMLFWATIVARTEKTVAQVCTYFYMPQSWATGLAEKVKNHTL